MPTSSTGRRAACLALVLVTAGACGKRAEGPNADSAAAVNAALPPNHPALNATGGDLADPGLPLALRTALDSGNAAFRAKDYKVAQGWYEKAIAADSTHPAGLVGLSMVAGATNDKGLAERVNRQLAARGLAPAQHPGAGAAAPAAPHGAVPPMPPKT